MKNTAQATRMASPSGYCKALVEQPAITSSSENALTPCLYCAEPEPPKDLDEDEVSNRGPEENPDGGSIFSYLEIRIIRVLESLHAQRERHQTIQL